MARLCAVTQPTVWYWLNRSKRLPAEHALRVEAETGVPRNHLCPDIYPVEKPLARRRAGRRSAAA